MADKFRTTFTIPVTFAAGEQPTNTKLNSVSTQSRNGLALLERAIGDLWNQGGDATSSAYPNRIVNIARALGDQALLTSKIPLPNFTGTTSVRIRQPIANFLGKSEILLDFKPTVDSTLRASVDGLRYTASLTYAASEVTTPTADDQWAVDAAKGRIKLGAALHSSQPVTYIEYNVAAADFAGSTDSLNASSFSMVPNQTQTDWKGLKICQIAANQYNIVLPFRRPDASPAGLSKLPLNSNNSAEVGSPSVIRYWGPAASGYSFNATISSNKFYRYTLPQVVLGMFTSPVAGTVIPSGSLYLWDTVTNTIVEGVTFKVPSITPTLGGVTGQQPFILQVDGASLDQVFNGPNGNFTSSMTTDVPADYMSRFALICVGQSLADAVSQLRKDLTEGDASVGPRKRPSHRDLAETQPAVSARHAVNIPPSFVDGDDHPHLLSRLGSADTATTTAHRDRFNNGILGDLLLLSSGSASNYQNQSSHSNKLYFGSKAASAPRLGTLVNAQSAGPAYGNITTSLLLENAGLLVSNGLIGGNDLHLLLDSNRNIAVFDDANELSGVYWGQRLLLNATTQLLTNFTGSVNSTRYIDVNGSSSNLITWKGGILNLSAVAADTNPVVVGSTNSSTHLRLANNQLHFGSAADNDTIKYNDTAKTFTARVDGNNDTTNLTASIIVAGSFRAANNAIQFGGNSTTAPDDTLVFDDSANTFTFSADGATDSATVVGGILKATARQLKFGPGANDYDIFVDTASDEVRVRKNGSTNVTTLLKTGKIRADNSSADAIKSDGGVEAFGLIRSTSDEIQGDTFRRNNTASNDINLAVVPSFYNGSYGITWSQLDDIPSQPGLYGPRIAWLIAASENRQEVFWFPIPWLPPSCTVTGVSIYGVNNANTTARFQAALGTEFSGVITSFAEHTSDIGGIGYKSLHMNFSGGGYVRGSGGGDLSVVLGLKNNSSSSGTTSQFRITGLQVHFSYDEVKL